MADNEKLLKAARMIKEHCASAEKGDACPLAYKGVCRGFFNCSVMTYCEDDTLPRDWILPKPCRWTENDMIIAKALIAAGFDRAARNENLVTVFALKADGSAWPTPSGLFKSINASETVTLADIIAEYEAR